MRVIFLGLFYNPEEVELFLSKSSIGLEEAPNTLQLRILDGLFAQQDVQLTVLNSLPFGTFPKKYRQLFLKTRDWNYKGHPIHDLGYINLPWVKLKMREQELYTSLCSILDKAGGEDTAILAYSLYLPFLRVFRKLAAYRGHARSPAGRRSSLVCGGGHCGRSSRPGLCFEICGTEGHFVCRNAPV